MDNTDQWQADEIGTVGMKNDEKLTGEIAKDITSGTKNDSGTKECEGITKENDWDKDNHGDEWSEDDINWLIKNYSVLGPEKSAIYLKRSKSSIRRRARIHKVRFINLWTDQDISFLKENYVKLGGGECAKRLNRKKAAVQSKACALGVSIWVTKPWNEKEISYIRENYLKMTLVELSSNLQRSTKQVRYKLSVLGLTKNARWTAKDEQFLLDNYQKIPTREISLILGRSMDCINVKHTALVRPKHRKTTPLNEEEVKSIIDNYQSGKAPAEISRILNISVSKIKKCVETEGVNRNRYQARFAESEQQYQGKKFGKLLVVEYSRTENGRTLWLCNCDCGQKNYEAVGQHLSAGGVTSCGCQRYSHGKEHHSWDGFEDISMGYFAGIRNAALFRGLSFNVSIEYIWDLFLKQDRKCIFSGVKLHFAKHAKRSGGNASLDRIDSLKGYEEGNLQWVHKNLNHMKWNASNEEFFSFVKAIYEFKKLENFQGQSIQDIQLGKMKKNQNANEF